MRVCDTRLRRVLRPGPRVFKFSFPGTPKGYPVPDPGRRNPSWVPSNPLPQLMRSQPFVLPDRAHARSGICDQVEREFVGAARVAAQQSPSHAQAPAHATGHAWQKIGIGTRKIWGLGRKSQRLGCRGRAGRSRRGVWGRSPQQSQKQSQSGSPATITKRAGCMLPLPMTHASPSNIVALNGNERLRRRPPAARHSSRSARALPRSHTARCVRALLTTS